MKVNQFEEIPAIKELDDELAATCSGGIVRFGGNNPDLILYSDSDSSGRTLRVNASIGDGPNNLRDQNFNDVTSSISIIRGTWSFYRDADKKNFLFTLRPGDQFNVYSSQNDLISSLLRIG
ncbi:beta/gamma crystallin-related protein [Scytonema sp. NUACC26]|uniref:beta/gamma crystallin-related protein n=1 Tax=Scytonema sp. NUACC26 TaxID=3140176 RepID=UPI0034DC6E70